MGENNYRTRPMSRSEREWLISTVGNVPTMGLLSWALLETNLNGSHRLAWLGLADSGAVASTQTICNWTNLSTSETEVVLRDFQESGYIDLEEIEGRQRWVCWCMLAYSADLASPVVPSQPQWVPSLWKRRRILERDDYTCAYCGAKENLSLDHVVPRIRGGGHDDTNLVTCCRSCNTSKGTKTVAEFIEWRQQKRLLGS